MAQLSRPYQVGLAVIAVLAAAWLLLIHGHGESSGNPSPGSSAQVASTPAHTSAPATHKAEGTAGQATGHGSASSLGALGHAVEKARGAVSTSERNAKQLSEHSSRASSETTTTSTSRPAETTAAPSKTKGSATTSTPAHTTPSSPVTKAAAPKSAAPGAAERDTATAQQHRVEAQLAQGKVAVILFWDPKGAEDRLVRSALRSLRGQRSLDIGVDEASPGQVASFGTITRGVQIYGTPTLLFVNKHGQAVTLTGFQDAYSISQAVREARRAS